MSREMEAMVAIYSNGLEKIKELKKLKFNFYSKEYVKCILYSNNNKILEMFNNKKIIKVINTMNNEESASLIMECCFYKKNKKIKELFIDKVKNNNMDYFIYDNIFAKLYHKNMKQEDLKILDDIVKEGFCISRKSDSGLTIHDIILKYTVPEMIDLCEKYVGKPLIFDNENYTLKLFEHKHHFLEVHNQWEEEIAIKYLDMLIERELPFTNNIVIEEIKKIQQEKKISEYQLNLIKHINMRREKQLLIKNLPLEINNVRKRI